MSEATERCQKWVWSGDRWTGNVRCKRTAKVERDGVKYCGQHDPVAVEARDAKKRNEWKAKYEGEKLAREQEKARNAATKIILREIYLEIDVQSTEIKQAFDVLVANGWKP